VTLSVAASFVWAVLAAFTAFDFLPVWIPILLGAAFFAISGAASQNRRALTALIGSALLLGGVSLWVQTEVTKPAWLVAASLAETQAELELEVLNRPRVIYQNFDRSPVYGVAVFLKSIDQKTAAGRGYLIFDGQELARGEVVKLEGKLSPAGRNSRDAFLVKPSAEIQIVSNPTATQGFLNNLRAGYVKSLSGVTPDAKTLVAGLAIGEIAELSSELEEKMRVVSLTHLVAVSGSNCAIVVGMVYLIAVGLRFGRTGRTAISLTALLLYILLIGPDPSVLRAGVMAASVILMIALGRRTWALNALALAALVLLIADPWLSTEFGFGLSVLATAGILLLAPAISERLANRMPMPLALGLSVTLSAQLFCLPLLMQLQPGLATYSVIANLLAGPMVAPVTVLGMIALVVSPFAPWLTGFISFLASFGTWVIEMVAIIFADLPVAYFPWATGLPATILSVLLILAIAAWLRAGLMPLRQLGLGAVVVIAVTTISVPAASEILPRGWPIDKWQVVACDVGQGDALVIQSQGRTALVDVGSDADLINRCLTELSIKRIDLLVLTHFDIDHVGGLAGALKSRKISQAIVSGFPDERPATAISFEQLEQAGAPVLLADPSISGTLGEYSWRILAPTREAAEASDSNDASVVMVFIGPRLDLLLLGDLGESGQQRISDAAKKLVGSSTKPLVLKVSHHGSNDQSAELHENLRPDLSLISVGKTNGYGHPGSSLLDLLERSGSKVLRTDLHGSIAVSVAGDALSWAGSGE
jgi:competence protein ComEC